jgi:hypothetical protein
MRPSRLDLMKKEWVLESSRRLKGGKIFNSVHMGIPYGWQGDKMNLSINSMKKAFARH